MTRIHVMSAEILLNNPLFISEPDQLDGVTSVEKIDELYSILDSEIGRLNEIGRWLAARRAEIIAGKAGVAS